MAIVSFQGFTNLTSKDGSETMAGSSIIETIMNPRRTIHTWHHHDAEITLKLNRETGKIKLSFYYTPLSVKVNEIRLEAYQKRTRSFLDRINHERAIEMMDMMR